MEAEGAAVNSQACWYPWEAGTGRERGVTKGTGHRAAGSQPRYLCVTLSPAWPLPNGESCTQGPAPRCDNSPRAETPQRADLVYGTARVPRPHRAHVPARTPGALPPLQTGKGAPGCTGEAQTRARAVQRGAGPAVCPRAPNIRHPYTDAPMASQGGRAEWPGRVPSTDTRGQRGRPPWGRTGAQGAGSKLTSPRPGRGSWVRQPPLQVVPLNCPQTPPGCLAGLRRRVGGEGGIPGETPPVPQQPGGPGGAQSLRLAQTVSLEQEKEMILVSF